MHFVHKVLNEELNHRVKNMALIKSIVSQPVEAGRDLSDYVNALRGRIMALAQAHDQVVRADGGSALRDLFESELRPYAEAAAISIDGPDVGLDARAYSVLALVLHEMATNAAKYGALSTPKGKLSVKWTLTESGACEIKWVERGGPETTEPTRRGFGTVLLTRSIPFDLHGESQLKYESKGVSARFLIPANFISELDPATTAAASAAEPAPTPSSLEGLNVLLLEDQLVIALDADLRRRQRRHRSDGC